MAGSTSPSRGPLFEAQNSLRYERQQLIRQYQEAYNCRLVVMIDTLFSRSVTLFEEVLYDADPLSETVLANSISAEARRTTQLIRTPDSTIAGCWYARAKKKLGNRGVFMH